MRPAVSECVNTWQISEKATAATDPDHLVVHRLIPRVVEVTIANHVCLRVRSNNAVQVLPEFLRFESPDQRLTLRSGQLGFQVHSHATEPVLPVHLHGHVENSTPNGLLASIQ